MTHSYRVQSQAPKKGDFFPLPHPIDAAGLEVGTWVMNTVYVLTTPETFPNRNILNSLHGLYNPLTPLQASSANQNSEFSFQSSNSFSRA